MRRLLEETIWFPLLILVLYILLDVADSRWFIPRMRDKCKGEMTEQQEDRCYHWIYVKGKNDVGINP